MIGPYVRRPPVREVGIVGADGSVLGGTERVYVGHERAHRLLVGGEGDAVCWNGDPIRLRIGQTEAIVLRCEVPDDDAFLSGLVRWRDWLASAGAGVGSLGSSAWSLLRATLSEPIHTSWGSPPPLRGVVGGRQVMGRRPGRVAGELRHLDLRSSYPSTIADLRYGGAWGILDLELDQAEDLARVGTLVYGSASVRYPPGLVRAPLCRRPRGKPNAWRTFLQPAPYPTERVTGFWTVPELIAARDAGAKVKLRGCWVHAAPDLPFRRWWDTCVAGRELGGFAGQLAKLTANALWGQLAISTGERQVLSFAGGRRRVRNEPLSGAGRPRVFDLAEYVTGSIRARLFSELLVPAGDRLVCAHTDGGWVIGDVQPAGEGWRVKDRASVLYVVNPQSLAYRRLDDDALVYRFAGVPSHLVRDAFRDVWRVEVGTELPRAMGDTVTVAG